MRARPARPRWRSSPRGWWRSSRRWCDERQSAAVSARAPGASASPAPRAPAPAAPGRARNADGAGEVDRAHELVQRAVGEREMLAAHGAAVAGEPLAQVEEHRLRGPGGLVAELGI